MPLLLSHTNPTKHDDDDDDDEGEGDDDDGDGKQTNIMVFMIMRTIIRTMMMIMKVVIDNDREMLKK